MPAREGVEGWKHSTPLVGLQFPGDVEVIFRIISQSLEFIFSANRAFRIEGAICFLTLTRLKAQKFAEGVSTPPPPRFACIENAESEDWLAHVLQCNTF